MKQEHEQLLREALQSAITVMATWSGDWSTENRLVWLYGLVCGWEEESLQSFAKKWDWSQEDVERLQCYHHLLAWIARKEQECLVCHKLKRIHRQVRTPFHSTDGTLFWVDCCESCYHAYLSDLPSRFEDLTQ